MPYVVKTYMLVEQDEPEVYDTIEEANSVADNIEGMSAGTVKTVVERA